MSRNAAVDGSSHEILKPSEGDRLAIFNFCTIKTRTALPAGAQNPMPTVTMKSKEPASTKQKSTISLARAWECGEKDFNGAAPTGPTKQSTATMTELTAKVYQVARLARYKLIVVSPVEIPGVRNRNQWVRIWEAALVGTR